MIRAVESSLLVASALVAAALSGCGPGRPAATETKNQVGLDEASVRLFLSETEERINQGDLSFVDGFADDAVIVVPSGPNIAGIEAIRELYSGTMAQADMNVHFSTEEIAVAGDLAYERGTYTMRLSDKTSSEVLQDVKNKHVHIFKRSSDGAWKTWRVMVSSAEPPPQSEE